MRFEKILVDQCAPTLARIKTGSLFTADCGTEEKLNESIRACAEVLGPKDVHVELIRVRGGKALIYVFRKGRLEQDLCCPVIREFLASCGYGRFDAQGAVETLKQRMGVAEGFPHEIGLFLGYPVEDVLGFVSNCGRNCLLCGPWKVYHDVSAAQRQFARMRKCFEVYKRLYGQGRSLEKLTVPA